MRLTERMRTWARSLKAETCALYLACRDPRVPWYARLLAVCVVGYAFSPIDLIPDFIPVIGYLDDLLIVPLGIALVLRMIPAEVMSECRCRAAEMMDRQAPVNWRAAAVIIALWVLGIALAVYLVWRALHRG
jgi:uncharacterized membrane protein YkvA (DUF1232 family)